VFQLEDQAKRMEEVIDEIYKANYNELVCVFSYFHALFHYAQKC